MTAHTKGPWAVSKQKARRVTASGVVICNAVLRNQGGPKHKAYMKDEQEAEANARLIAAAPMLLEALDDLLALYVRLVESGDAGFWDQEKEKEVIAARAAIAAARQESAS